MKWKRAICGVVMAGLLLTPAYASQFSDTGEHWANTAIERWSGYGVIGGYPDGSFGPNDSITRAQMAVILSRVFGWQETAENTFGDVSGSEWYAQSILQAKAAGVMAGDNNGNARPNDPITRQEAAVMLSRALRVTGSDDGKTFGDSAQIGAWAASAINGMSQKGFIGGSTDGNFYPARSITRAETMTILNRAVVNYYNQAGSYSADASGITIIAAPGVTLQNMTVDGDLFIAPGANASEVVLQNVTVTGQTYIQTGRSAEVILSGSTLGEVQVEGTGAKVTFGTNNTYTDLTVSGDSASLRGLPEQAKVTVAAGTDGVAVNGHDARPGTVTAGTDISTDEDDVEIDFEISGSGGSTSTGSTSGGTTSGGTTGGDTGSTGGGATDTGNTGSDTTGGTGTSGDTTGGGSSGSNNVDEDGNIIIDFGDLVKP